MTSYAEGIGGTYEGPTSVVEDGQTGRNEKVIVRTVGGQRVVIKIREFVAPPDPLILLTKASIYTKNYPGSRFPVPAVNRRIKEALIKAVR